MIRAIGLAIYTYEMLEEHLDFLWEWAHEVEQWYGVPYSEIHFSPRNKRPGKVLEASPTNRKRLYKRLHDDMPWSLVSFGFPEGILNRSITSNSMAMVVSVKSFPQPRNKSEIYRHPSYLSIEVDPHIFLKEQKAIELVNLGVKAFSEIKGIYGFIDIDDGIPPDDNLTRNIGCVVSNLIPDEFLKEFTQWQAILPILNKRIWKVFWGNYLCPEHLQQLGGFAELRRADWFRPEPEVIEESYRHGQKILLDKVSDVISLGDHGYFFSLSQSPLNWNQKETQSRRKELQNVFAPLSIADYSL